MDIRELRSFVQVAHAGSFSRAAQDLFVAQPALSRQIAKLEQQLNVTLFTRHGRGVELTAAGARLLERAEIMLHYVQETTDHVRNNTDLERGHLTVGWPPAIGGIIGTQVIKDFCQLWPHGSLHVLEGSSGSLQEWVLDGRVDIAIAYNQPLMDALDVKTLYSEPMLLVGPPGEPERTVPMHELADLPLILPGLPHTNRRLVERAALQNGIRLKASLEVDSVSLTKRLINEGLGYSILAYAAIYKEAALGRLSLHTIGRPGIRSVVALTRLRERRSSPLSVSWEQLVIQSLKSLLSEGQWKDVTVWLGDDEANGQ